MTGQSLHSADDVLEHIAVQDQIGDDLLQPGFSSSRAVSRRISAGSRPANFLGQLKYVAWLIPREFPRKTSVINAPFFGDQNTLPYLEFRRRFIPKLLSEERASATSVFCLTSVETPSPETEAPGIRKPNLLFGDLPHPHQCPWHANLRQADNLFGCMLCRGAAMLTLASAS